MMSKTLSAALLGVMLVTAGSAAPIGRNADHHHDAGKPEPSRGHDDKDRKGKKDQKDLDKIRDHEFARQAVLRHEVLPMPRVMGLVAGYQAGDVIEVELKSRGNILFYDVDVLVPSGQVHSLLIDARNGKLLANKAKG